MVQSSNVKKKEKKNIKNRKLKQKINNVCDVIFVPVIFSMLGASSYNCENKGKY